MHFFLIKSFFSVCAAVTTLGLTLNTRDQMAFKSYSSGVWLWIWGAPLRGNEIKTSFQDVYYP